MAFPKIKYIILPFLPDVSSEWQEPQVIISKSHSHFVDQISHV